MRGFDELEDEELDEEDIAKSSVLEHLIDMLSGDMLKGREKKKTEGEDEKTKAPSMISIKVSSATPIESKRLGALRKKLEKGY